MKKITLAAIMTASLLSAAHVSAAPIYCSTNTDPAKNYMQMDASSCLGSGVGTISGNTSGGNPDEFLTSANGNGWSFIEKSEGAGNPTSSYGLSYTAGSGTPKSGTWSLSLGAEFWQDYASAALGFKFGTRNTPDEWFVFELNEFTKSGDWTFYGQTICNRFGNNCNTVDGGLSHLNLYAMERTTEVTEPGTLALVGLGLMGLGLARRRKMA